MMPAGNFESPDDLPAIHVCIIHNIIVVAKPPGVELIIQPCRGKGGGPVDLSMRGDGKNLYGSRFSLGGYAETMGRRMVQVVPRFTSLSMLISP